MVARRVHPQQRFGNRRAEGGTSRRAQLAVEGVLIHYVDEPIAHGQRAIRELALVDEPHEPMHALQGLEPFFDMRGIEQSACATIVESKSCTRMLAAVSSARSSLESCAIFRSIIPLTGFR